MLQRTASMELIGAISIAAQGWLQGVLERGPTYAALRNGDIAGARAIRKTHVEGQRLPAVGRTEGAVAGLGPTQAPEGEQVSDDSAAV